MFAAHAWTPLLPGNMLFTSFSKTQGFSGFLHAKLTHLTVLP